MFSSNTFGFVQYELQMHSWLNALNGPGCIFVGREQRWSRKCLWKVPATCNQVYMSLGYLSLCQHWDQEKKKKKRKKQRKVKNIFWPCKAARAQMEGRHLISIDLSSLPLLDGGICRFYQTEKDPKILSRNIEYLSLERTLWQIKVWPLSKIKVEGSIARQCKFCTFWNREWESKGKAPGG